jgi:hypothetical protein
MRRSLAALALGAALLLTSAPLGAFAQGTSDGQAAAPQTSVPQTSVKPKRTKAKPNPAPAEAAAGTATEAPAKKPRSEAQKARDEKLKSCNAEYRASGQKGREAHKTFMSQCMKKT